MIYIFQAASEISEIFAVLYACPQLLLDHILQYIGDFLFEGDSIDLVALKRDQQKNQRIYIVGLPQERGLSQIE